jgi:hypothetical protein
VKLKQEMLNLCAESTIAKLSFAQSGGTNNSHE